MSQQPGPGPVARLVNLGTRPARRYAVFMAVGSAVFTLAAVILLAQSGSGVDVFAEGRAGTPIPMPAAAAHIGITVYAVARPGEYPELDCKLATRTREYATFKVSTLSASSRGRTLTTVATVGGEWSPGDTLTCSQTAQSTSAGPETLVLGRNTGLTHLMQGLLAAFAAVGSGILALIGFATRRHLAKAAGARET